MNKALFTTCITLILLSAVFAQKKDISIAEQVALQIPTALFPSPDGKYIAFTIRTADLKKSKWNTQVYLMQTKNKEFHQFSANGRSCTKPQFTPDAKYLTFLTDRELLSKGTQEKESGSTQIWYAPLSGGEAKNLTSLPNSVDEYTISKKGIVAVITESESSDEKKGKGDETVYPKQNPAKQLVLIDFATAKIVNSYSLDPGARNISFTDDGSKIYYQTNKTGEFNDEQDFDIYSITLDGKKKQVTIAAGPEEDPLLSPDGKMLAYKTQTVPDIEFAETDLIVQSTDDARKKLNLTEAFNQSIVSFIWKDKNLLYFTANNKTDISLYSLAIPSGEIIMLSKPGESISDIKVTANGILTYRKETPGTLPEIIFAGKTISSFSKQLDGFKSGTQEVIVYRSRDKRFDIEGILFKPEGFSRSVKYPLIVTCHGGPYGNFKNTWQQSNPVRQLLAKGYVVFAPNPRGSSGYSDEFSQANRYDLGGGDYQDIMEGVNFLAALGFIDTTRMGVMGGSYGGYMTNWIISQSNRFKAAVSLFGIFSYFTDWSNSWQPSFEKMYFGYYYWEKPIDFNNLYIQRSPAFYIANIQTPTLILQGEKDLYTDIANSREMYQALKAKGVPVEFVVYPREGHGIKNEPNHYINTVERSIGWLEKYLR